MQFLEKFGEIVKGQGQIEGQTATYLARQTVHRVKQPPETEVIKE